MLSDILGDPLDMIASGPAYPDSSTCAQALEVVRKYGLRLSKRALELLAQETPKTLTNVETHITGSVRQLCASAEQTARALGYTPVILTASLRCTARDAGSFLASIAQCHQDSKASLAYIAGGETVVHLTGHGLGGRNQEIALSAAQERNLAYGSPVCAIPPSSPSAPTAPTARPTPRAATATAIPARRWRQRAFRSPTCCRITTPTTRCRPAAV